MSDSLRPHRRQPMRLPRPWDSPGKNTGVGCHFFLQCIKLKSENEVAQLCPTLSDPWTAVYQAPPSLGFSRQEYWSGVPLPFPIIILLFFNSLYFYNILPVISLCIYVHMDICLCLHIWFYVKWNHNINALLQFTQQRVSSQKMLMGVSCQIWEHL